MIQSNSKKGVGHWATGQCEGGLAPAVVDQLGCGWFYNWRPRPMPGEENLAAEFIPMMWSGRDVTDEKLAAVKAGGNSRTIIFFNLGSAAHTSHTSRSVSKQPSRCPKLRSRIYACSA